MSWNSGAASTRSTSDIHLRPTTGTIWLSWFQSSSLSHTFLSQSSCVELSSQPHQLVDIISMLVYISELSSWSPYGGLQSGSSCSSPDSPLTSAFTGRELSMPLQADFSPSKLTWMERGT